MANTEKTETTLTEVMLIERTEVLKDIMLPTSDGVQLTISDLVKSPEVISRNKHY